MEGIVQNILFYSELTPMLEQYRLDDLRKEPMNIQHSSSFAYYMRNQISTQKISKTSLFVCLDMRDAYFINNSLLPTNFIFLGNIPEYSLFKRQVNTKYLSQKQEINLNKYTVCLEKERDLSEISNSSGEREEFERESQWGE
jgi:hypothetical protein